MTSELPFEGFVVGFIGDAGETFSAATDSTGHLFFQVPTTEGKLEVGLVNQWACSPAAYWGEEGVRVVVVFICEDPLQRTG
jgi:hypothetical protein